MDRLSTKTVDQISVDIDLPAYDRDALKNGIVHLGIGAFHRAHQAVYTDTVLAKTGGDWMITGVSLRSNSIKQKMEPQDGLFSVMTETDVDCRVQVIGSVKKVLFLDDDRSDIVKLMCSEEIRIVSLTITEKGYCRFPATGDLDLHHPDIQHDLQNMHEPRSAIGLIVHTLAQRRQCGTPVYSVLSCDNLPENGSSLRRVVVAFAKKLDPDLADWIEKNVCFPSTMVDRIVPAPTRDLLDGVSGAIGVIDEACISTEPFSQWVIEDRFSNQRPDWSLAGATFTNAVAPYENMKLRLLNGAHSAMAYLGCLAGQTTIADCMANDAFRVFVHDLMEREIMPTVEAPDESDLSAYINLLIERFSNRSLHHKCSQIAMDGSQKIPQRLLVTIEDRLRGQEPFERLSLAVAAWIIYSSGVGERGEKFDVDDPLAADFAHALQPHRHDAAALAKAGLAETRVFSNALANNQTFQKSLTASLDLLLKHGSLGALSHV